MNNYVTLNEWWRSLRGRDDYLTCLKERYIYLHDITERLAYGSIESLSEEENQLFQELEDLIRSIAAIDPHIMRVCGMHKPYRLECEA